MKTPRAPSSPNLNLNLNLPRRRIKIKIKIKIKILMAGAAVLLGATVLSAGGCAPAPDPRLTNLELRISLLEKQLDFWTAAQTNETARAYETFHRQMQIINSIQETQGADHRMLPTLLDDYERLVARATNRPARKN